MRAKKCDRKGCEKYFEPKDRINDKLQIFYDTWGMKDSKYYDLCPECMKKIEDFLKGENL